MLKKAAIVGGAAAGMLALAPMAHADSAGNDGINILNDLNINAVPINLCGNNVAILGVIVPVASPQTSDCNNAPIVDHPHVDK
ncbi:hypothetical protein [Saccharopolyspora sp. CA-218241]|uniref:hypothetical protein n=1 Tax=Saccharopolyspora sp. CA-218241 TaxID=3240027 RepID=UPI003D9716F2